MTLLRRASAVRCRLGPGAGKARRAVRVRCAGAAGEPLALLHRGRAGGALGAMRLDVSAWVPAGCDDQRVYRGS